MIPEYGGYIPFVGEDAHGDAWEPTEEECKITFEQICKSGKFGSRDLEMYLRGVEGLKFLCQLMKYLVQTGVTPQFIANKLNDVADADDENKAEVRREITNFVRKIIAGAFAIRSYDYLRVKREDELHIDPVSLVRAVTEREGSFAVVVTLNKVGVGLPAELEKVWEGKLRSSQQSDAQLGTNIRLLDPADRSNIRDIPRPCESDHQCSWRRKQPMVLEA